MSSPISPSARPRRTRVIATAAAAVVLVAGALSVWLANRGDSSQPVAASEPSSSPSATATELSLAPTSTPTASADAVVPGDLVLTSGDAGLEVFASPTDDLPASALEPWSLYGSPMTLLGFDTATVDDEQWFEVELPGAPNHERGWVHGDTVTVSSTTTAVHVYLDERELDLEVDGTVTQTAPVVIGDPETPTPLGVFWVTDPLDFTANDTGVYGAYALGLNGFSEVLEEFNGGPPQIAIHGTNEPELLGEAVSNGCIRMTNDAVLALAAEVTLGTPVIVHESREA